MTLNCAFCKAHVGLIGAQEEGSKVTLVLRSSVTSLDVRHWQSQPVHLVQLGGQPIPRRTIYNVISDINESSQCRKKGKELNITRKLKEPESVYA